MKTNIIALFFTCTLGVVWNFVFEYQLGIAFFTGALTAFIWNCWKDRKKKHAE